MRPQKQQKKKKLPLGIGNLGQTVLVTLSMIYLPGTQVTLVLIGKGMKRPCFGGLTFKNRGHLGSRYIENIGKYRDVCDEER